LPIDDENVRETVAFIKNYQARIDRGAVEFGAYGMSGTFWARVRGLNEIVDSLRSSTEV
jgi:hypothetical protein